MSKFFYKDKPIIGLDISSTGIKIMSIDPKKWLVNGYGSLDLDPIKIKESLENDTETYLTDNIKLLKQEKNIGTFTSNRVPFLYLQPEATQEHSNFPLRPKSHLMMR